MSTLIDRMAAVLREVQSSYDGAAETYVIDSMSARYMRTLLNEMLAEYDALRAAAKPRAQVGQRIRVVNAQLNEGRYQNGEEGVVVAIMQSPFEEGVRVDFGPRRGPWFLYHSEYEIIPNLPAVNTGD